VIQLGVDDDAREAGEDYDAAVDEEVEAAAVEAIHEQQLQVVPIVFLVCVDSRNIFVQLLDHSLRPNQVVMVEAAVVENDLKEVEVTVVDVAVGGGRGGMSSQHRQDDTSAPVVVVDNILDLLVGHGCNLVLVDVAAVAVAHHRGYDKTVYPRTVLVGCNSSSSKV
jgi:hypothetical protein